MTPYTAAGTLPATHHQKDFDPLIMGSQNFTGAAPRWQRDCETMSRVNPTISAVDKQRSDVASALSAPVFVAVPCPSSLLHAVSPTELLHAKNMGNAADAQRGSP